ncbi:MAG: transposase [Coriobacteriales bacterium]|nr:transposase [Coriobacteriales bacterium]
MLASDLSVHRLDRSIAEVAAQPWLCAVDPTRDFTRRRLLPLGSLLHALVTRDCHSIGTELLDHLGWTGGTPGVSSYCKARRKLNDGAMRLLNSTFLRKWDVVPYLGAYRLMLADGTGIPMPASDDESTRIRNGVGRFWHNEMHPTLAYDPVRDTFEDAVAQGARKSNEPAALNVIVDRFYPGRAPDGTRLAALWAADRNYATLNVFCHMIEAGASFCIRASDSRAEGLLGAGAPEGEFDLDVEVIATKTRSVAHRSRPDEPGLYRVVKGRTPLDAIPDRSFAEYPMRLRVVRVALPADDGDPNEEGDRWLNLVTNLPRDAFAPSDLEEIYRVRWKVELRIRDLKHNVGMRDPRTRDPRLAAHEMWGSIVCYNCCSLGMADIPDPEPGPRHERATDRSVAFRGMRRKMLGRRVDLEAVCARHAHSVRRGRKAPRRKRPQRPPSFPYRG